MEFAKDEASQRRSRLPRPSRFRPSQLKRPFRLKTRKPYIVPTGFGLAFGTLAFIQLIMAIASQNNLIYLFVFFEISIALASMFFTNMNIQRVQFQDVHATSSFAKEENTVEVTIANNPEKPTYQLSMRWTKEKESTPVPPASNLVHLKWIPKRRGWNPIPAFVVESSFPFGLLRAWKIERFEKNVLIYPELKGKKEFPPSALGQHSVHEQGIFYDLRPFQRGDWPKRIDWKASQRSQKLLIRRFEEESHSHHHFHWQDTSHLQDFEDRISQLAVWIERAEREGSTYSLQIGKWNSGSGRGQSHWAHCLNHLATLEPGDCQ